MKTEFRSLLFATAIASLTVLAACEFPAGPLVADIPTLTPRSYSIGAGYECMHLTYVGWGDDPTINNVPEGGWTAVARYYNTNDQQETMVQSCYFAGIAPIEWPSLECDSNDWRTHCYVEQLPQLEPTNYGSWVDMPSGQWWDGGGGGGTGVPPNPTPLVPALTDVEFTSSDTIPKCGNPQTSYETAWCTGAAMDSAELAQFKDRLDSMRTKGSDCANLAAIGDSLIARNRIRVFSAGPNFGGAAPLGGGWNSWMVIQREWFTHYATTPTPGGRTLGHTIAHELDHLDGKQHVVDNGVTLVHLTPNTLSCGS